MNTYGLVLITYMGFRASLGKNHRLPQPLIVQTHKESNPKLTEVRQIFFLMTSKHSEILKKK